MPQPNSPDHTAADQGRPPPEGQRVPQANRRQAEAPRPNRWFLAVTVLLQAAWIAFLLIMALRD